MTTTTRLAGLCALVVLASACSRARPVRPTPVSKARIGQCSDPNAAGVIGERPSVQRADRDLDGDGNDEIVLADRNLCTEQGNCYWNVFARDNTADCYRYTGTIAARVIDQLEQTGDNGFHHLRGWWRLSGEDRVLVQEYRYHHDGYEIAETMVCRQMEGDRLECAPDGH